MEKQTENKGEPKGNGFIGDVSNRFYIIKNVVSDFALFAIVDGKDKRVVCHLVYDNGEKYCDEMANKMLAGLNGC